MRPKALRPLFKLYLLGAFRLESATGAISLPSRKVQSLLAYLVLHREEHAREKLATLLWGDSPDSQARDSLRTALKHLRQHISADILIADRETVGINPDFPMWVDAKEFEGVNPQSEVSAAAQSQLGNHKSQIELYRGDLLEGFYDEWILPERERLSNLYLGGLLRLAHQARLHGEFAAAIEWANRVVAVDPANERAYQDLMYCYHALGDRGAALKQYDACVRALREELGVEPSQETISLYDEIKQAGGVPPSGKSRSTNLPTPLTSFIGRDKELTQITGLLDTSRLVTLTGPGGVGKTRLAIQAANKLGRKFRDGVFWVGLVGLADENLIPLEIAQSLNLRELAQEPLLESLKTHLKSRQVLIVLDNCEHLIRGCAMYAEQLLAACPELKILATSIESLGLFVETAWQVPSLPLPESQRSLSLQELQEFASIELFTERARTVNSRFALTDQNSKSVAQICRCLDGIPLAIELAAARIKVLSVDEIAARLDDRFSLLTAGSRTAIPRHQTLRATINWSYDLLTEAERILFCRLAVFAGGFTLEAAEAVCNDEALKRNEVLDVLGRLADKSLVIVEQESPGEGTRYRLLETIRQYALERLIERGETPAIRMRHLEYYLVLAEESEPYIYGSETAAWFRRLDKEIDNIRAAIEWSTSAGRADAALRILGALVYFWFAHGLVASEWHERVQQALARQEGKKRTIARAKALNGIGFMYWADIYPIDRRPELEEALSIAQELGDPWNTATALRNLGLIENIKGNYAHARGFLEESLTIWREMGRGESTEGARSLLFLGDLALNSDQAEQARILFEEAAGILKQVRDANFLAYILRRQAQLDWHEGHFQSATSLCEESLRLNQAVGDPRGVIACLAGFAAIAVARDEYDRAVQLMGAVESQLASVGIRLLYVDKMEYDRNLARLNANMEAKALAKHWEKGRALTLEQAIDFALQKGIIGKTGHV